MSVSFHFSLYYTGDLLMFEVALLIPRDSTDELLHASRITFIACSLVSETIPEHRDYRLYGGEKAKYRKVGLQSGSTPMIQLFVLEESRAF
jgi:hypothetical protein